MFDKKEYRREWQSRNKEKCHQYGKEWRNKNLKYNRERVIKWRKKNPLSVKLYRIRYRCQNQKCKCYGVYGGKGIKCLLTLKDLKRLWIRDKAHLLKKPSIDRKNRYGNYEYSNCQFIEMSDNIIKSNKERIKK
jgi:hypothetical protein